MANQPINLGTAPLGGDGDTVRAAFEKVNSNTSELYGSKLDNTDPRLSDAREWTAATVTQAEAEAGTATTRRAWTAQRVRQAIVAWWNGSGAKTQLDAASSGITSLQASKLDATANAVSAGKLATARTIGGVAFDGTANINLPGVNAAGTQATTGNAATATALQTARTIGGVAFDGTANITLPGVNAVGNQSTTGNAATATALQTARTINGVSFNGTANITVADTTKQAAHANLSALSGLTGAADRLPYFTGAGALSLAVLTAAARTFLAAPTVEAQRTAMGLGTAATSNITTSPTDTTAGRLLKVGDYGLGSMNAGISSTSLNDLLRTGFYMGSNLGGSPDGSASWFYVVHQEHGAAGHSIQHATLLGTNPLCYVRSKSGGTWGAWRIEWDSGNFDPATKQAAHVNLSALSGLTGAADRLPYFTGAGALSLTTLTGLARNLLDDTTQSGMQSTLGLGSASTRAALGTNGALYSRDSILGTVSQSAGVPTGAIIEYGSNANGEYVRWADGTQICSGPIPSKDFPAGIALQFVGLAAVFSSLTGIAATAGSPDLSSDTYGFVYATSFSMTQLRLVYRNGATAQVSGQGSYIVTGRWY